MADKKINEMDVFEKIEAAGNVLDKLADTSNGRAKCGLIWVMNDIISNIGDDVAEMNNKIRNLESMLASTERNSEEGEKSEESD